MSAVLLSFGSALALKHHVHLTTSSVLLAVVLALTLGRRSHGSDLRSRLLAPLVLGVLAVAAAQVGTWMFTRPDLGDSIFVVGVGAAIWVRRFGPVARRAGVLATSTLVATLITPGPIVPVDGAAGSTRWWGALIAIMALGWVTVTQLVAERSGFLAPDPRPRAPAAPAPSTQRRLVASTRMALQMSTAVAGAFVAGRAAFGVHWTWTVLTAFIVCSGNRGRGDVVHKAVRRVAGAAAGTLAATAFAGAFPVGDDWSIIVIFAILAVAVWLRPINYAFWATGMTAALALLYGYYGERGGHLLLTRLAAIVMGATIGVAVSWLLLPVRTIDVVRRQLSVALATLSESLTGPDRDARLTADSAGRIRAAVTLAADVAAPLHWQRRAPSSRQSGLAYVAATRALAGCLPSIAGLTDRTLRLEPQEQSRLRADLGAARRALASGADAETRARLAPATARAAATLERLASEPTGE
jgi:Fusaric acid resistance protein family